MIDTPAIVTTSVQLMACIHVTVARSEIQRVMGPGLKEIMETIGAQGAKPSGPWFTHHLKIEPGSFDFEICVPVEAKIRASGRVNAGEWPAMKVARTIYHGGYQGMGGAWGQFEAWIKDNGYTSATDLWERYLVGPESGLGQEEWKTELNRPLVGK